MELQKKEGLAMGSERDKPRSRRFVIRQVVLLVVTIALVIFCTIPLLKAFRGALNPAELDASLTRGQQELEGLQNKLDVTRSRMLMGAGDDESRENLKKQVEDLKRQLEMKELENKHLQNEVAMAQLLAEVVKSKSTQAPAPAVDTEKKSEKPVDSAQKTDKPTETAQKSDKPADTAPKSGKPSDGGAKPDKPAATVQTTDKLMETASTVDKLVAETSQKVDKLVATGTSIWELLLKVFGSLGSIFTGMTFAISWLRKRREPPPPTVQVASK
jgi:hypothetical protein